MGVGIGAAARGGRSGRATVTTGVTIKNAAYDEQPPPPPAYPAGGYEKTAYPPQQGYPPQGYAYPPQGYEAQPGYPPQHGYPPQQGYNYPPPAYPVQY